MTGFTLSRSRAISAGESSVTCMPGLLERRRAPWLRCSRETLRWKTFASVAASWMIFFSSAIEPVPDLLADDHDLRVVDVAGEGQMLLHLVELGGQDHA